MWRKISINHSIHNLKIKVGESPLFCLEKCVTSRIQNIENFITPVLKDLGFNIVRVMLHGSKRKILQVMIERIDGHQVIMENCVKVSREISALFDVEDPIDESYSLEVTSPGIDRPLVKAEDYKRFINEKVWINMQAAINNQRKFSGVITAADENVCTLKISTEDQEPEYVDLKIADIFQAHLDPDIDFKSLMTKKANESNKV